MYDEVKEIWILTFEKLHNVKEVSKLPLYKIHGLLKQGFNEQDPEIKAAFFMFLRSYIL